MKLKSGFIVVMCCLFSVSLLGQKKSNLKYEYYFGLGCTNFMADIAAPKDSNKVYWVDFFNTIGYMGNAGLKYKFNERHFTNVNMSIGQLYAYESIIEAHRRQNDKISNTFFTELTGRYEFLVLKEKMKTTVYRSLGETALKNFNLPTYLFVGIGGLFNIGNYTRTSADGRSVDKSLYYNYSLVIPYGIGIKTRLSSSSYLNLEVGFRFVYSDKLDYVKLQGFDQYQFFTINYIKKLKAKENGLPKF